LNDSARDLLGHELEIDEDTFRTALDPSGLSPRMP
jgi:hypothetical protein